MQANKEVSVKKGDFNPLQVHFRDPQTKQIVDVKAYRLIIDQGTRFYEYPKGSSNLWWENREPAGVLGEDGRPIRGAEHKVWTPPVTVDQTIAQENATLKQDRDKIAKELEAIKKEMEMQKTHPAVETKTQAKVSGKAKAGSTSKAK